MSTSAPTWPASTEDLPRTPQHAPAPVGQLPLWPLFALIVLYPIWWALGLSAFVAVVLATPMAWALAHRRPLLLPAGFALWGLFLLWVAAGALFVNVDVPGTLAVTGSGRYLSYAFRLSNYLAVTVVMLYAGNLTERELPQLRLVRWLGILFMSTVAGGVAGTLLPGVSLPSPVSAVLPASLLSDDFVARLVTPSFAQVQDVLGFSSPRPSAPFAYTNDWGNNYSMLLLWFAVGWLVAGSTRRRAVGAVVLLLSVVPVVYSLNRGLWIGLLLSAGYVALRLLLRGRTASVGALVAGLGLVLAVVLTSPLAGLLSDRLATPHSNEVRTSLSEAAYEGALRSPVVGWGSTRAVVGSGRSIAEGRTEQCPQCGNRVIGSQGQLWQMMFAHGFVGAGLYVAFFLRSAWRYRRDHSPIGIAGGLGATLPLFYMLIYGALTVPLMLYLLSVTLLWRNERIRTGVLR